MNSVYSSKLLVDKIIWPTILQLVRQNITICQGQVLHKCHRHECNNYVALTSDILPQKAQRFDNAFIMPLAHAGISMVIVMLGALRWCAITLCNMEKYHHRKWIKLQIVYISMGIKLASSLGILLL